MHNEDSFPLELEGLHIQPYICVWFSLNTNVSPIRKIAGGSLLGLLLVGLQNRTKAILAALVADIIAMVLILIE